MNLEHRDTRETHCSKSPEVLAQIEAKARGYRKNVSHGGTLCSGCHDEPPLPYHRYGRICKNRAALASYHRKREELQRLRAASKTQEPRP